MRMLKLPICLALLGVLMAQGSWAQEGGGMLFSYQPHAGERQSFDEGYREHLNWHQEKRDSLPWYGWDVIAGGRMGQFIDGTFGISFEALDRRVDPAGDAAHARRSFADHASATGRWAVRLRPELSTTTPLETGAPARIAQVITYSLPQGQQARFEEILRRVRERATAAELLPYSVYESVVGVDDAAFTVFVWRRGMAGFDWTDRDPAVAIRLALSGELGTVVRSTSELWQLRDDLTLVPDQSDPTGEPDAAQTAAWRTLTPGGTTACGFDDPFEFWVRDGLDAQLMIYLQGGGACWTHETCHPEGNLQFDHRIADNDHQQREAGLFDASNPDNPFRDDTVIFVPYCTGDFHLGDRTVTYETPAGSTLGPVTVRHAGYRNLSAVLDHVVASAAAPSRITVVGASAGAVASPIFAAMVATRFPNTDVKQIGDGAAGLRFPGSRNLLGHWGADSALARDGYIVPASGDAFTGLYLTAAQKQPRIRFSQIATASDARVAEGLRLIGEDSGSVGRRVQESYTELEESGLCFSGYVLPGEEHTLVWRSSFYSARIDGVPLVERLRRDVVAQPCVSE